ncbi:hypothetical protein ABFU49_15810 [Xanthomonas campestris pv. campestris]|uniref:hypothetical protein n=1 Tax=Xanthomonas campestris TaxID=339 RepID=UPI00388D9CE5
MSALFEQFLAGEDGISALLRALPAYAPPAGMDAWFVQAASVAHAATTAGAAAEAPQAQAGAAPVIRAAGAQTFDFEPPASLQAAFSAAAAQADQAQASQRQAVQTQLAHGVDAVQAVGAPLSAQARAWIDAQQHVELAERHTAFARSVSSRGDAPSDSEPYTGAAAPAAINDLAEAASARRFEINSNNKTDSDSDSDNHRLGKHVHAHAAQDSSAPVPQPASERDTREVAAAATTQAPQPAMADTHVPAMPALRSTRRRRWMPTLAFAASITLAVGVGLQWQAHQPVPDAAMDVAPAPPSDARQATTDSGQPPLPMAQMIDAPAASSMAVQAPIDAPASSSASAPAFAQAAPPSTAEAPAVTAKSPPAPAPPLAPAVARPAAAPAPPAPSEFAVAAAPSLPEPMAEGNAAAEAAPTAAPPAAAPIAASRADASADASLAQTTPMRPAAMPRTTAAAEAEVEASSSVMDRSKSPSSVSPADMASVPAATVVGEFSAPARRAPLIHNDARRDSQSAPLPTAESLAMQVHAKPSPAPRPAGEVVALSVPPADWLAQHATSHAPPRIRLWAAAPDAPAVQRWAAGLRKQIQQRGWTTRVDVLQDTQLAADQLDQLRVDVSSSNAQE